MALEGEPYRAAREQGEEGKLVLHISEGGPSLVKTVFLSRNWSIKDADVLKHCTDQLPAGLRSAFLPFSERESGNMGKKVSSRRGEGTTLRLCWRSSRYKKSEYSLAGRDVLLNHFKDSSIVTRKDKLLRALRKMRGIHGAFLYDFIPSGYILPTEYTRFVKEFAENSEREKPNLWICKPSDLSRGRKIFLLESLHDLKYDQQYIIQKYVADPLTIGGYKVRQRILFQQEQPEAHAGNKTKDFCLSR